MTRKGIGKTAEAVEKLRESWKKRWEAMSREERIAYGKRAARSSDGRFAKKTNGGRRST